MRQHEFDRLMDRALDKARHLAERCQERYRICLLVSPDIASEYFGDAILDRHLTNVIMFGYEVLIAEPTYVTGMHFIEPVIEDNSPWLDYDDIEPGTFLINEGELYVSEIRYDMGVLSPVRLSKVPCKIMGFSDIGGVIHLDESRQVFEYNMNNESDFLGSEFTTMYNFRYPSSYYDIRGESFNAPIDKGRADPSELLQFLNTFTVNNEQ